MPDKPHRGPRRTWPQRLVLVGCLAVVVGCLVSAGVVWYGNNRLGALERVTILHGGTTVVDSELPGAPTTATAPDDSTPAKLRSQNFLLVGSDTRACLDNGSPFAPAVEAQELGERSDTIIVVRVEPQTNKAAMLSFPRDLWVKIAGTGRQSRINAAYDRENPSRLVQTIEQNFGIPVDHYVEVTFCAFKRLVDAVGGVKVPFEFAARDKNTGLNVQPGCVEFNGDAALAYVRSRHYEWFDGKKWHTDNASDFGRIARQQDFIRRSLQRALDRGARRPTVAKALFDTALENVRVDDQLTLNDLLELSSALRDFDPGTVQTYRIDGSSATIGGAWVLRPQLTDRRTKAILEVFSGRQPISALPDEGTLGTVDGPVPSTTTTTATTLAPTTDPAAGPTTTVGAVRTTTTTTVDPASGEGIFPPNDPTCR